MAFRSKEVNQHWHKLLEVLKKKLVTLLLISRQKKPRHLLQVKLQWLTSSLMDKQSVLIHQDSWLQKPSSTQASSKREMKPQVCTLCHLDLFKNVILIFVKIFIQTLSSLEEPLYIKVSQIDLRKKLMLYAQNLEWSKLLQVQIDTTLSGLVVPLFPLSPPSKPNGSPRKNSKKMVLKSSIENAYDHYLNRDSNPT